MQDIPIKTGILGRYDRYIHVYGDIHMIDPRAHMRTEWSQAVITAQGFY